MQRFVDSVLAVAKEWAPFSSYSSSFYIDLNKMIVSLFLSFMYCSSWVMSLWVLFIFIIVCVYGVLWWFNQLGQSRNVNSFLGFYFYFYFYFFNFIFFNVVVVINNQDYLTWLRNGLDYATSPPPLIIIIIIISFV